MSSVVLKIDGKFEFLYIKEVPVFFASVHEPKNKLFDAEKPDVAKNPSTREYAVQFFVTAENRAVLEDEVKVNKQLFEVGKDKNKKRVIKYPLAAQAKEGKTNYDLVKGLHGMSLTLNELNKGGKPNTLTVIDKEGNPFTEDVGNGSICTVKCYGYRNQDDLLVVAMTLVQVLEHVPYEGGKGEYTDDELGVTVKLPPKKKVVEAAPEPEDEPEELDDSPF